MSKIKKCKKCGATIAKGDKNCSSCGAKQRHILRTCCIVIVALAIASCALALQDEFQEGFEDGYNGNTDQSLTSAKSTTQSEPNEDQQNIQKDNKTDTQENPTSIDINSTLSTENFEFTIQSAYVSQSVSNQLGVTYTAPSGSEYLIIIFNAKNTSDDTQNVMNTNFNSYMDNRKISIQSIVGEIDGYMPLLGAVSPQMTFTGYTVWEMPAEWNEMQFSYIDALSGSESEKHFTIYRNDI